jgi:hypothetical protein
MHCAERRASIEFVQKNCSTRVSCVPAFLSKNLDTNHKREPRITRIPRIGERTRFACWLESPAAPSPALRRRPRRNICISTAKHTSAPRYSESARGIACISEIPFLDLCSCFAHSNPRPGAIADVIVSSGTIAKCSLPFPS